MSFRTSTLLHNVLVAVQAALVSGETVDAGVLGDFNAGVTPLVDTGREPSDGEFSALTQLGDAVASSHAADAAGEGEAGDADASSAQVTEPSSGEPEPAEPAVSANIARLSEIQEAAYGADGAQMKALKAENQTETDTTQSEPVADEDDTLTEVHGDPLGSDGA